MALENHYEERYGQWAGNQRGRAPDYKRCCESVMKAREYVSHQCAKPNGHGPDGAYCATHNPEAVAKRQAISKYNYDMRWYQDRKRGLSGADEVLRLIADGHNDPRTIAREWLAKQGDKLEEPKKP